MQDFNINQLNLPYDIKNFSTQQLEKLAEKIRAILIKIGDECGGHLASNLGVVELSIALHAVLDSPKDKIIWDVSHQSYIHKILTGRLNQIFSIRKFGGLSGFTKISESDHDAFGAGHSSTALSAALGLAHAREINQENYAVTAIVGDGSLSGGMAFEALNNISKLKSNFICILNDNDMSISKPIGSMATYMTKLRTSTVYTSAKKKLEKLFSSIPRIGVPLKNKIERIIDRLRSFVLDFKFGVLFEEFGFLYLGPLDGHDLPILMGALKYAKHYPGPIMIHVITKKGKGYLPAEEDPIKYHGISPKNPKKSNQKTFTEIFGETVLNLAKKDSKITVITPAMIEGSGLREFSQELPQQLFDVGIAEEHAITFAGGLARGGVKPIVAIYSSFLQRGYDQLIHDIALQNLPVIFAIDRAGLVGEDGPTHHGTFDVNFLLPIPNLIIISPKDIYELKSALKWAVDYQKAPIAIRFPRGITPGKIETNNEFQPFKAEIITDFAIDVNQIDYLFISYGTTVFTCYEAAKTLFNKEKKTSIVVDLKFLKPFDFNAIKLYLKQSKKVIVVEETTKIGSFYAYLLEELKEEKNLPEFMHLALPDQFIEHGEKEKLLDKYGLSVRGIVNKCLEL